jgi:pyruvate kinase
MFLGGSSGGFIGVGSTPKSRPSILSQLSPLMLTQGLFGGSGGNASAGAAAGAMNSGSGPALERSAIFGTSAGQQPNNSGSAPAPQTHSNPPSQNSSSNNLAALSISTASAGNTPIATSLASPDLSVRKTKICCTLGPATSSVESLTALLLAGMNIARFNMSHGTHAGHLEMLQRLRVAMKESGQECALLLDTKGPEIRTGLLKDGVVELKAGQELFLRTHMTPQEHSETYRGDAVEGVSVDYAGLSTVLHPGSTLKIDDGLIVCKVIECMEGVPGASSPSLLPRGVRVRVENNAQLGERKGINLPGTEVDLPSVTERDKADLRFAVENNFHLIAASFCRDAGSVADIRSVLQEKPQGRLIHVIAKIENQQGLDNFEEILQAADGIMVARGDLGVEIPIFKVSTAQKFIIRRCNQTGKPVITATQMLESMISNPRPTRAEGQFARGTRVCGLHCSKNLSDRCFSGFLISASDVANAVLDGTDCVMLSGETAKGQYGPQAVSVMSAICLTSERAMDHSVIYSAIVSANLHNGVQIKRNEAITMSAVKAAADLGAKAILVFSESGASGRLVAKYRPACPVIMLTPSSVTFRQARLLRGVWSLKVELGAESSLVATALAFARSRGWIQEGQGQSVILVSGNQVGVAGATNTMRILDV